MNASGKFQGGDLVKRNRLSTRLWHWLNVVTVFVMIMSGLMIFNAHPMLYWGQYGANNDPFWLAIQHVGNKGHLQIGNLSIPTSGIFGVSHNADGSLNYQAFPSWITLPASYDLEQARRWHLTFAWLLTVPWLLYFIWSLINRHLQRDLTPTLAELAPKHILHDISQHARLRFPTGVAAMKHNILQKLSYMAVLVVLIPSMILSGLTLSPGMTAAWPWLLVLMGGRATARSVHFIGMSLMVAFIIVHLLMVVLAGPYNEVRSMITGKYRLPKDRVAPALKPEPAE